MAFMKVIDEQSPENIPASTPVDHETVMGPNPYFPEPEQDPAPTQASPDQGQSVEAEGTDEAEPTFDPEQDAAAGFDVNDPNYKHFQAAYTRKMQAAKERDLGKELDELKLSQQKQKIDAEQTSEPLPEVLNYAVPWDGFRVGALPEDNPLSGHEETISKLVRQHVEYAVSQVNKQSEKYAQTVKLHQTRDYLTQVVDEIGNVGGAAKKQEAMNLLQEHLTVAKSDPVKWARFAVNYLGINVNGNATPAPKADPARTVQQVKGQGTRPSVSSGGIRQTPEFKGPNATAKAIAYALDQQLK